MNNIEISRSKTFLNKMLIVDGQAGCGKTMFSSIVSTLKNVEILNYSTELENICALYFLKKISIDAAIAMIKIQNDEMIYKTMMSRGLNFRPSDLSSFFRNKNKFRYLKRLFKKGNELIPALIHKQKPILHFVTHNLTAFAEPLELALKDKLKIIEIVRHPLYMIKQQTINHNNLAKEKDGFFSRHFHLCIGYKNFDIPYWNINQEELYLRSKPVERAIYEMNQISALTKQKKLKINSKNIMTISFEKFLKDPNYYIDKIEIFLNTKSTSSTRKSLIQNKIPRKKLSEGVPLKAYKEKGWDPPKKDLNEKQEFEIRRNYCIKLEANKNSMDILDKLSSEYEKEYDIL